MLPSISSGMSWPCWNGCGRLSLGSRSKRDALARRGQPPIPPPVSPKPEIDKSVPLNTRVRAFLEVSGPSKFQQILRGAGCMPAQLTEVLNGAEFVFNEVEKTYTLTRHR